MNVACSLLFTTSQLKGEGQLISQTLKFELVLTQTDIFKLKRAIDLMAPKVATGKKSTHQGQQIPVVRSIIGGESQFLLLFCYSNM